VKTLCSSTTDLVETIAPNYSVDVGIEARTHQTPLPDGC
jgi:hypothetical protein